MRRLLLCAALAAAPAAALAQLQDSSIRLETPEEEALLPDTELIDQPTASVLDYGALSLRARFSNDGTVTQYLSIGVLQRFNVGASFAVDRLIGTNDPVRLRRPNVQLKWRFYDGSRYIPAVAMGFDGQGYFYNDLRRRYDEDSRGLYFVGSHEVLLPGLWVHPGVNISDFDSNSIYGFFGLSMNVEDKLLLMAEWDNVQDFGDSRLNLGAKVYVTPYFHFNVAVRELGGGSRFSDGTDSSTERIVQLKYVGNF